MYIPNGATLWARQTIESEIFRNKPDKWFKIWFYIVQRANHTDTKQFKRGSNFFKYDWIMANCGATKDQIKHCVEYLKHAQMIHTQKAIRGFVVSVLNYNKYQELKNYKSHTKSHTKATL